MNTTLTAAILLLLVSGSNAGEQIPKPVGRPLLLTMRMVQLQEKEGKEQVKFEIFHQKVVARENERFKVGQGIKRGFEDSGESLQVGQWCEGKVKRSDPLSVVVDLKIIALTGNLHSESSGVVLTTGEHYELHSKQKLGEPVVIKLTKPGEGRPKWLELTITPEDEYSKR